MPLCPFPIWPTCPTWLLDVLQLLVSWEVQGRGRASSLGPPSSLFLVNATEPVGHGAKETGVASELPGGFSSWKHRLGGLPSRSRSCAALRRCHPLTSRSRPPAPCPKRREGSSYAPKKRTVFNQKPGDVQPGTWGCSTRNLGMFNQKPGDQAGGEFKNGGQRTELPWASSWMKV